MEAINILAKITFWVSVGVIILIGSPLSHCNSDDFVSQCNFSLNLGRFFPLYEDELDLIIDDQDFGIRSDVKDDMSFGADLKLVVNNIFLLQMGGEFFFGEENINGELNHQDIAGGINAKRDLRKSSIYFNAGLFLNLRKKLSMYLSVGPAFVYVDAGEGNIEAEFYPRSPYLDTIQRSLLLVESARLQKEMEKKVFGGSSADTVGFNGILGVEYYFEDFLFMDAGLRYSHDKVNLWESENSRTGGISIFLGVGFSFLR